MLDGLMSWHKKKSTVDILNSGGNKQELVIVVAVDFD
jgi:hypothetical protein